MFLHYIDTHPLNYTVQQSEVHNINPHSRKNLNLINDCYLTTRLITFTRRLFTENCVAIFVRLSR